MSDHRSTVSRPNRLHTVAAVIGNLRAYLVIIERETVQRYGYLLPVQRVPGSLVVDKCILFLPHGPVDLGDHRRTAVLGIKHVRSLCPTRFHEDLSRSLASVES